MSLQEKTPPVNPGSYGSTQQTATPGVGTSVTPTAPPTTRSFPQSPTGQGLGVNGIAVANISVNDFLSHYDISTTEENTFLTQGKNGQPALNQNALYLMQYQAMSPTERQDYQESLVNAGLLPAADANGIYNSASVSAFKNAISTAAAQGIGFTDYLTQYQGTNNVNTALAAATGQAEKEAQAPVSATLENPTTLAATITNAFDQTLGYAPSQDQINSFISQIQGQDVANAEAPHQAAVQQLAQLKSDQSALTKLGPDGINDVVTAYTNAVHGLNLPSGGAQQGPQIGTSGAGQQVTPAATAEVPGTFKAGPTTTQQSAPGALAQLGHIGSSALGLLNPFSGWSNSAVSSDISGLTGAGVPYVSQQVSTGRPTDRITNTPATFTSVTPIYGGVYALTPADWAEVKKLMPKLKLPATPGAATPAEQEVAFKTLLQNVYDNNGGSWADAIVTIAGGQVGKAASEKELGTSTNLQTFATNIASQVNDQLSQLTNEVNTQNVTEKVTTPDATAEANLAAKTADPVGYYAANAASAGSILNQMLAGAPQMYYQSTADTFTGPVTPSGVSAAAASSTPTAQAA